MDRILAVQGIIKSALMELVTLLQIHLMTIMHRKKQLMHGQKLWHSSKRMSEI
jgi:hypothetical protein